MKIFIDYYCHLYGRLYGESRNNRRPCPNCSYPTNHANWDIFWKLLSTAEKILQRRKVFAQFHSPLVNCNRSCINLHGKVFHTIQWKVQYVHWNGVEWGHKWNSYWLQNHTPDKNFCYQLQNQTVDDVFVLIELKTDNKIVLEYL